MKPYILAATILISVSVLGCDDRLADLELNRDTDAPIQTDQLEYELEHNNDMLEMEIPQLFTNPRQNTAYIVNCNGHFAMKLQKQIDGEWMDAFSPVIQDCLSSPIKVAPRNVHRDTLRITAGLPSDNVYPKFQVEEIEGVYRLVWVDVLESFDPDDYPFGPQIPLEQRVSNKFVIQKAGN